LRYRLLVVFLALVLLPLGLIGWLGLSLQRHEQQLIGKRFDELITARLQEIDARIASFMADYRTQVLRRLDLPASDLPGLRERARREPRIRQLFVLDAQGGWIYPGANGTPAERDFRQRLGRMGGERTLFYTAPAEGQSPAARQQGWTAWMWGDDLDLLLWRRDAAGRVVGAELDRLRLLSELVGMLPESAAPAEASNPYRIALLDAAGQVVYQWGQGMVGGGKVEPAVSLPLGNPLQAWRLAYYTPADWRPGLGGSFGLSLLTGLGALGLALLGLAIYFYREYDRDLREARQRVSFVNQVSHELKTPLTNIRLYAELLEETLDEEDDDSQRYLGIIRTEAQRLSRLIGNILTFARKQRNTLRLEARPGVLAEIAEGVVEQFRPSLESQGITVELQAGDRRTVTVDADVVAQILGNLIGNVQKYAAFGRYLGIELRSEGARSYLRVSDRGPGIPAAHAGKIFQPFYRISSRLNDGVSGTGIGLALARELARLHGGDLRLLPSASGATFEVELHTP